MLLHQRKAAWDSRSGRTDENYATLSGEGASAVPCDRLDPHTNFAWRAGISLVCTRTLGSIGRTEELERRR